MIKFEKRTKRYSWVRRCLQIFRNIRYRQFETAIFIQWNCTRRPFEASAKRIRIYKDNKTCKEIGANIAYNEKLKKDEVNALYRKTLSAKKMLANRNPDIPMYLKKYEKWKAEANQFKQDIKSGIKTQEEFKKWIENTKKSY